MIKRVFWFVVALGLSFASGLFVGGSSHPSAPAENPALASNAAYRDGLYQAKLDAREGRKPHFAVGRWSTEAARTSYIAGYQDGYRRSSDAPTDAVNASSIAQLAAMGFRDGMLDGTRHRMSAQPFQPDQTPHYREAGVSSVVTANPEMFRNFYREAYVHGYQQAYYSSSK
jgi:hypothetical protein